MQATEIGKREYTAYLFYLILFQWIPDTVADEQEDRFGMIDNMMYVVRIEILQDGDYDCTIRNSRHIDNTPAGTVFTDQSDFISPAYLTFLKQDVDTGYFLRYILKCKSDVLAVICQCG